MPAAAVKQRGRNRSIQRATAGVLAANVPVLPDSVPLGLPFPPALPAAGDAFSATAIAVAEAAADVKLANLRSDILAQQLAATQNDAKEAQRLFAVERAELEAKQLKKKLAAQKKEDGAVQLAVLKEALEKSTQQTEIAVLLNSLKYEQKRLEQEQRLKEATDLEQEKQLKKAEDDLTLMRANQMFDSFMRNSQSIPGTTLQDQMRVAMMMGLTKAPPGFLGMPSSQQPQASVPLRVTAQVSTNDRARSSRARSRSRSRSHSRSRAGRASSRGRSNYDYYEHTKRSKRYKRSSSRSRARTSHSNSGKRSKSSKRHRSRSKSKDSNSNTDSSDKYPKHSRARSRERTSVSKHTDEDSKE